MNESNLDEFDELTMEELRSLLDNFKNLSKSEQMDLVQYMRKLETTDPEKVRQLKEKPGDKPAERYFTNLLTMSTEYTFDPNSIIQKVLFIMLGDWFDGKN